MKDQKTDWQVKTINTVRDLIKQTEPDIVEEIKWRKASNPEGVPVWSYKGMICTGEKYKDKVKLTFIKGSALADKTNLFNAGSGTRRAIDLYEGDTLDKTAFKKLIQAAIKLNIAS